MKKFTIVVMLIGLLGSVHFLAAQNVGISDEAHTPDPSAMLDVYDDHKGFLPPRVELTASNTAGPITSPATGLVIYNTKTTSSGTVYDVTPGYYYNAGDATTPNWVQIVNSTGTGIAPLWDDFRVSLNTRYSGNTQPGLAGFAGSSSLLSYYFGGGSQMQEIFFEIQLPHTWVEGSAIRPHVHWSPGDATSGNVVWNLEYTWANYEDTYPASTTISNDPQAANGQWKSQIAQFPYIDGTGKKISSILMCRLYRNPIAPDTYTGNAFLLGFDIHILINGNGSRLEYIK
ncbi:MAG: hypothetical protein EOM90_08555 [Alphaproteobacteria bacterium]|nr:hypothetical protein [Alphaproteobacteria bacterium]